ncbi:MAG: hypothetical protein KC584_18575, partial [Nitrospira sp.]|nr:hypothetical protein [Nitrospira sp.]
MYAEEQQFKDVRKLKRTGQVHGWLIQFFKVMVLVGLLFPTFALPTVWAEVVPDVVGSPQASAEGAITA